MKSPASIDALCLAIADGAATDFSERFVQDSEAPQIASRLAEIAALKSLFDARSAGAGAAAPVCPFDWGRLEVLEVIGQGGFALVYRAHDPVLDRDVALKLFRHDRNDLDSDQLIAEARQHARVHHPRVLAVHGADVDDGIAGLWTDLLVGGNLAEHVEAKGSLDAAALRTLAADLTAGLAAVHEQEMVHADLKPGNVWLDSKGRAMLMDFGAAEALGGTRSARFGSPVAMAPELFEGSAATTQSDLYALGVVLYFAATACWPVTGSGLAEIGAAHRAGLRPDFAGLRERLPEYAPLIEALLDPRPVVRPSLVAVESALVEIASAPQRRFRRRAIGAVIATLIVGLAASLLLLQRSERARADAEQARSSAELARVEAEAARQRAERARADAQTSKDFLIDSVRNMSPEAERGLGTVRAVLEFLQEFSDERLADTPMALGEMKVVVGSRLTEFDDVERGLALAEEGIAQIEKAEPQPSSRKGLAYYELADSQRQVSRYADALETGRRALDVFEQLEQSEENRYQIIQIRGLLSGIHGDMGNWSEELTLQRRQLADRAAMVGEDDPRMAVEYNNLAQSLMVNGHYEEALDAFRRSMQLLELGETRRPFPEALVTHSISVALLRLNRFQEAQAALDGARQRFTALGTEPDNERFQRLDRSRAGILRGQGRQDEAVEILQRLIAIDTLPLQNRYNRTFLAFNLLDMERGEEALGLLREARESYPWPKAHPEHRFLNGAIAYAEATAGGDPAASREVVAASLAYFEESGYGGTNMAGDLRRWLAALDRDFDLNR